MLYGIVSLWSIFVLLPLLWMVFASFKTRREIFTDPLGLPDTLDFESFERAWNVGLGQFLFNSAFVTAMSVALIVVVSGMAAYVLARSDNKWLQVIYLLIVAGFAVPVTAVLVPLFQMVSAAGFLNNHLAIVLPYAAYGIPFTTILFYAFFLDFPRELEEAARLDGCSQLQIFFRDHRAALGPGRRQRRDLPGGLHLERVHPRAADADAARRSRRCRSASCSCRANSPPTGRR